MKNHSMNSDRPVYTPGHNVFGQRAETHYIKLEKETAFSQMIDVFWQIHEADGRIEFTIDSSNFDNNEEVNEIISAAERFVSWLIMIEHGFSAA